MGEERFCWGGRSDGRPQILGYRVSRTFLVSALSNDARNIEVADLPSNKDLKPWQAETTFN